MFLDISYFEDDDEKLKKIEQDYRKGDLLTGELKQIAVGLLQEYVKEFQERRKTVTDDVLKQYMTPRKLEWKGNPRPIPRPKKEEQRKKESTNTNPGRTSDVRDSYDSLLDYYLERPASKEITRIGLKVGEVPTEAQAIELQKELADALKVSQIINNFTAEERIRMERMVNVSEGQRGRKEINL